MAQRRRKHRPVAVEDVVLRRQFWICACGCGEGLRLGRIDFDHDPPLELRTWVEEKNDYDPAENDENYIFAMVREHHRKKTNHPRGPHTVIDSDLHAINKARKTRTKEIGIVNKGKEKSRTTLRSMKIKGQGFRKDLSKHMDGTVTKRIT